MSGCPYFEKKHLCVHIFITLTLLDFYPLFSHTLNRKMLPTFLILLMGKQVTRGVLFVLQVIQK